MKTILPKTLLSAALLIAFGGAARAELEEGDAAVARVKVALRERPGSDYRVVTRLEAGDSVSVERVKGEWVRVKVGSRTGWAPGNVFTQGRRRPRKGVDDSRSARKKAFVSDGQFTRRGAAARDDTDTVTDEDTVAAGKVSKAKAAKWKTYQSKATARKDEESAPESDETRSDIVGTKVAANGKLKLKSLDSDTDHDEGVSQKGGGYRLSAGLGFVSMTQDFSSDANLFLAKYRVATAAAAVSVGAVYSYVTGIWEVGGDGGYRFTASAPGIEVTTMSGQKQDLTLIEHSIDLGGRIGYRSGHGMRTGLYARLGYHLDSMQIDQSKLAPLPSENISGFTMGAGLDVPGLSEHIWACAHFDFMFSGSRDQTVGLRDGKDDGTQGLLAGVMLGYRVGDAWAMTGGYNLSYMTTSFTGPSERLMNQGTWGARENLDHILMVGLHYVR